MTEVFTNQPFGTVTSGGTDLGSEPWTVSTNPAAPFPAASTGVTQFHVADTDPTASSEIILVTNISGSTWTVTRGAEGTTPVVHEAGFTITQVLTAGWLSGVVSGVNAVDNGGTGLVTAAAYTLLAGGTTSTSPFQQVASAGTVGQVLTSNGAGTLPSWQAATGGSTVTFPITVTEGGTGGTAATTFAVVTGGTAATAPFQQVASLGTAGQVLTSQGAGSLPSWTNSPGLVNPMSALGDMISGGTAGTPVRLAGGTAATKQYLTQTGAGTISAAPQWGTIAAADVPTLNQPTTGTAANVTGTVATINGGTGLASLTTYAIVAGGTASTSPVQQIAAGTSGQVLTGNGAGTLPSFQANVGFINPMAVHGDTIYENAALAPAALPGNTTSTKNFLTSTGSGGTANTPAWGTIASADVPTLNQNTTGTAANVTGTVATINGGTGLGSITAYAVVTGGTSSATALQTVSGLGTAGQGLMSNGAGSLPSWQTMVDSVTAADTTIVIAGTGAIPTVSSPRHASQAAKYSGVSGQPPRESIPFWAATSNNSVSAGVMYLTVIPVEPGDVISNVGFQAGATPAFMGTNPNWWTALYSAVSGSTATFIAQSGTQGSTAIGGASAHLLALGAGAPYTVPGGTTYVYGAVMINTGAGGTQPTIRGPSMNAATVDASTSMFTTSAIYSGTNGAALAGSAPSGTVTLAVNANLLYLGAD